MKTQEYGISRKTIRFIWELSVCFGRLLFSFSQLFSGVWRHQVQKASLSKQMTILLLNVFLLHILWYLLSFSLRYNLHRIKLTNFQCTILWVLINVCRWVMTTIINQNIYIISKSSLMSLCRRSNPTQFGGH